MLTLTNLASAYQCEWSQYGHTATRHSIALDGPNTIDSNTLAWIAWEDPCYPGYYIEFEGLSNPIVYKDMVFIFAKYYDSNEEYTNNQIIAFDSNSGETLWNTVIEIAAFDSWSSPAVDSEHDWVLIGSGQTVYAMRPDNGEIVWETELNNTIVNTSLCISKGLRPARAFITDYDGYGSNGRLYCINLDANDFNNPYNPGDVVWSEIIGGTSGNSCAYKDGVVFTATITDTNGLWGPNPGGTIYAYRADTNEPVKLWTAKDPNFEGFFGGLTVTKEGFVYAANYDFYNGENNSAMCKIDCNNGQIIWIAQVERTRSVPIVVDDMVFICGGLNGYGSRPKLQAFKDLGDTVTMLWETPPEMVIGGWTHQPVYAEGRLYVGAIPTNGGDFSPYTDLYIVDANKEPNDTGFIIDHYEGCGSSPAVTYEGIYSIGMEGLHKFHQPAIAQDIDGDGSVGLVDLSLFANDWLFDGPIGIKRTDLNLDGKVDFIDFAIITENFSAN